MGFCLFGIFMKALPTFNSELDGHLITVTHALINPRVLMSDVMNGQRAFTSHTGGFVLFANP